MGRELESGVFETAKDAHDEPLLAYRIGEVVMMRVVEDWGREVKRVVAELSARVIHGELEKQLYLGASRV